MNDTSDSIYPYSLYEAIFGDPMYLEITEHSGIEWVLENTMEERERDVLLKFYRDGYTQKQIAEEYGISETRVGQIRYKAIRKMRHTSRARVVRNIQDFYDKKNQLLVERDKELLALQDEIERIKRKRTQLERAVKAGDYQAIIDILNNPGNKSYADLTVNDIDLSVRTFNAVYRAGFKMVSDFCGMTIDDLRKIRNLGSKSLDELVGKLRECGINIE